jgi:hypothetical protein
VALAAHRVPTPEAGATNGGMTHTPQCQSGMEPTSRRTRGHSAASTADGYHLAVSVNAMDLKNRLRDIETDCRDRLHV